MESFGLGGRWDFGSEVDTKFPRTLALTDFSSDTDTEFPAFPGFEYPRTSAPTWNPLRTEFGTGLNMKKVPGQVYVKKDSDRLGKAKWDFGSDLIPDFHEIGSNSDTNPILQVTF
uniref:Uncharacterized protein n=1 Tax=Rhizophagus irregularis (strain DAOM 181602 / DAOM 197198 / MUCL 43194) TaxID=747089 RepID=U9UFF7_RHIID